MKRKYFVVVEKKPECWSWAVWTATGSDAFGYAPTKALALKLGRIVRDSYEKTIGS